MMKDQSWPYTNAVDPTIYATRTDWPKISIVTPSFNQGQFIEETILSILNQNYPNFEYIIIDGGSTDNTVEVIKKYEDRITYWVSEKDEGQTHAINKGFEKASGVIQAYLNSDDCYYATTLFQIASSYLLNKKKQLLFIGNCYWAANFSDTKGSLDEPNFPISLFDALKQRGLAPQPSMFWTNPHQFRFNEDLKFCMDFDFWLKLILAKFTVIRLPQTLSLFRIHRDSKTSNLNYIQNAELNGLINIYKKYLGEEEQIEITEINIKNLKNELSIAFRKNLGKRRNYIEELKLTLKYPMLFKILVKKFIKTR